MGDIGLQYDVVTACGARDEGRSVQAVHQLGEGFMHVSHRRITERTYLPFHATHPHVRRGLQAPTVGITAINGLCLSERNPTHCQQQQ
ncbi:hypothetical protein D9M71_706640 [compost metagenome]